MLCLKIAEGVLFLFSSGLHCLLRPVCLNTYSKYGMQNAIETNPKSIQTNPNNNVIMHYSGIFRISRLLLAFDIFAFDIEVGKQYVIFYT